MGRGSGPPPCARISIEAQTTSVETASATSRKEAWGPPHGESQLPAPIPKSSASAAVPAMVTLGGVWLSWTSLDQNVIPTLPMNPKLGIAAISRRKVFLNGIIAPPNTSTSSIGRTRPVAELNGIWTA